MKSHPVIPPRRICAAISPGPESEPAIRSAAWLSHSFGCSLDLVTVVEPPHLYEKIFNPIRSRLVPIEELRARAEQGLLDCVAAGDLVGVRPEIHVRTGTPFAEIIAHARESGADLIVVGTRPPSDPTRFLLGSTAERVVRKSPIPVLVARQPLEAQPEVLLAPTDFSQSSRAGIDAVARLARHWEARLVLLHVIEPILQAYVWPSEPVVEQMFAAEPEELEDEWKRALSGIDLAGVRWEKRTVKGYAVETIVETARQLGASLTVVGTHGRSGIAHTLLGSVAEAVIRNLDGSVLSVRPPAFAFEMP